MPARSNRLKDVDFSRQGEILYVSPEIPPQTIVYSVEDVFQEQVFFTREAEKHIRDSRNSKPWQWYVLKYLDRIPAILRTPSIVIVDPEDVTETTLIYYKEIRVPEQRRNVLFALVAKRNTHRIVYNFHPQESGKVKGYWQQPPPKVLYLNPGVRRKRYF
jgi:hypothetical protein